MEKATYQTVVILIPRGGFVYSRLRKVSHGLVIKCRKPRNNVLEVSTTMNAVDDVCFNLHVETGSPWYQPCEVPSYASILLHYSITSSPPCSHSSAQTPSRT